MITDGRIVSEGITWNTLPVFGQKHRETKRRLVSFATALYFYRNFLHRAIVNSLDHRNAPWYRDNFRPPLTLGAQRESLNILFEFSNSYLTWLSAVGDSGGTAMRALFRWEGLLHSEISLCAEYLGHLTDAETGPPRYINDAYHQILRRMDRRVLEHSRTSDPVGLLIYLLYNAVDQFCMDNYKWGRQPSDLNNMEV